MSEYRNQLLEYRKRLEELSQEDKINHDLYLRKMALGEIEGPLTGFSSLDKIHLKYYTEEDIKADKPYMTVTEYLEFCNKNNLDKIAIDSEEGKMTYQELIDNYRLIPEALKSLNIDKGDRILALLPPISHEVILFYGSSLAGTAIGYVIPGTPDKEIVDYINEMNIKTIFVFEYMLTPNLEKEIYEKTAIEHIINIDFGYSKEHDKRTLNWQEFIARGKGISTTKPNRTPEDALYIAKTGGSTGMPKSVDLNDNSFNIIVNQYFHSRLPYAPGDRWIRMWALFSATAAVSSSHLPLCMGMELVLRNVPALEDFPDIVLKDKPNHLTLVPAFVDALRNSPKIKNADLSFIKSWGCGGAPMTEQFELLVKDFCQTKNLNIILGEGYGLTENASVVAMRMNEATTKVGFVGAPLVKTNVKIVNELGQEETYGQLGEICVKSDSIMLGYYNNPEMTKSAFITGADGKWLKTGDIGSYSEEGLLAVNGRMKRVIDIFPTDKAYPEAFEEIISKIPGVKSNVIVGSPDLYHEGFARPYSFAVIEDNQDSEKIRHEIEEVTKNKFPEYAWLEGIEFLEELPLTPLGKPDLVFLENKLKNVKKLSKSCY